MKNIFIVQVIEDKEENSIPNIKCYPCATINKAREIFKKEEKRAKEYFGINCEEEIFGKNGKIFYIDYEPSSIIITIEERKILF